MLRKADSTESTTDHSRTGGYFTTVKQEVSASVFILSDLKTEEHSGLEGETANISVGGVQPAGLEDRKFNLAQHTDWTQSQ